MKTIKILSENSKGLFTDKENQNDLSTEVSKLFDSGEEKVIVEANGRKLTLTGYAKRGATSANSAFTYKGVNRNYICKQLREYFGLPLYSKTHNEKFAHAVNIHLATETQLKEGLKMFQNALDELERKQAEEKQDKELQELIKGMSKAELIELLKNK